MLIIVAILVAATATVARVRFHGAPLASLIANIINRGIRGKVVVASVEWPLTSLPTFLTGGWIPVTVHGVKVYDDGGPDAVAALADGAIIADQDRTLLIEAPVATGRIDAHALVFGYPDIVVEDLRIPEGGRVRIEEVTYPGQDGAEPSRVISLLAAFRGKLSPGFGAGVAANSAPFFDLRDYHFEDVTVECSFQDFDLVLEGVRGEGFLYSNMSDPLTPRLYYALAPTAARGQLDIKVYLEQRPGPGVSPDIVYDVPLREVEVARLSQLPTEWPRDSVARDVRWDIRARSEAGATITTEGAMVGYWDAPHGGDYELTLGLRGAGPLLQRLSGGMLAGTELTVDGRVTGPIFAPRVDVDVRGLDFTLPMGSGLPPLATHVPSARAWVDLVTESGGVEPARVEGAGGVATASIHMELAPFWFDLGLDIDQPVEIGPYLGPDISAYVASLGPLAGGTRTRGALRIVGDGRRLHYDDLDVLVGRMRISGALLHDETDTVHTRSLVATTGKTTVATKGRMDLLSGAIDLGMQIHSEDLTRWLRHWQSPAVGTRLDGSARIQGSFDDPRACAELQVGGVPLVDSLVGWLGYRGELLAFDVNKPPATKTPCVRNGAEARPRPVLGGTLWASGELALGRRPRLRQLEAKGQSIDLTRIPLAGTLLAGSLALSGQMHGPLDGLEADARASVAGLHIAGEPYDLTSACEGAGGDITPTPGGQVCVRLRPDGSRHLAFAVARRAGGSIDVDANVDGEDRLQGAVRVDALPIDKLAVLEATGGLPIGGQVTADMRLAGTLDAPTTAGDVNWDQSWYRGAYLGHTGVRIHELGPHGIRIEASLLQGDLDVVAEIDTRAPYPSKIDLSLRRVELDRLAPELTALLRPAPSLLMARSGGAGEDAPTRMWLSGDVHIEMPLAADAQGPMSVRARLSEAVVVVDYQDARGRPAPLRLGNDRQTPIVIEYDGARVALLDPVTLIGPDAARFTIDRAKVALRPARPGDPGALGERVGELDVRLAGAIGVRIFEPYLRGFVDEVDGTVAVEATIRGPLDAPKVNAQLSVVDPIALRPARQEAIVSVRQGGRVTISNDQLIFNGAEIRVEDPFTRQSSALEVSGGLALDDFEPKTWTLQIDGELAGQMLLLAAPELISRASGRAELSVSVRGPSDSPQIDVNLAFDNPQPLTLTPRGLGRELRLDSGELELSDDTVELFDVGGSVGDNGRVTELSGIIGLSDWALSDADVTVSADGVPLRIPQELELMVNVDELRVVGDQLDDPDRGKLEFDGVVEIVDGRYFRRFNLISDVLSLERGGGDPAPPFYAGMPVLANADLDLLLDVRSFSVQNNLATIHMSGDLLVTGSPETPRFDGDIQVSDGEFKLPGARARFTRSWGAVTFSPSKQFPSQTPTVNLQSEGDYRDTGGQYHLITLTLNGSWTRPEWDLYTSSGLNKGQTFTMLFSGRTPAELRKSLGDEAPGTDPGRLDPAVASDNAADQILKDVAGDFISLLVEDTLRNLTNLDVARIEIGTSSIGFHAEKKLTDKIGVTGDLEQTGSGRTIDVRGEVQLSDDWSLEGGARSRDFADSAEVDTTDYRLRVVYRRNVFWPW
ncbi:translocation/assembly module TamB domain-containing protein [Haliangium sp.]|uniref:translocation/assembly module TamB domain-containing protein n=1 Tax=Haliangium sp. TaxID=2663208 RepID=UPI003D11A2DF